MLCEPGPERLSAPGVVSWAGFRSATDSSSEREYSPDVQRIFFNLFFFDVKRQGRPLPIFFAFQLNEGTRVYKVKNKRKVQGN